MFPLSLLGQGHGEHTGCAKSKKQSPCVPGRVIHGPVVLYMTGLLFLVSHLEDLPFFTLGSCSCPYMLYVRLWDKLKVIENTYETTACT